MEIITGRQQSAIKTCIYGPEGIGKTTFASHFPRPVFIDTEGSTRHMDVHRTPRPSSFAMLLEQVRWFRDHPDAYGTLVGGTADWAEQLCAADLCARTKKTGIEDFGYSTFLTAIEPYKFDILIYDGTDPTVQTAMTSFIQRMNEDNGQYCQLVGVNFTNPDSRYVINVMSPATLNDGTELTMQQVCWWVGGAEAGAMYNESLTNATYPNAVSTTMMTNSQYIAALNGGQFVLTADNGRVYVEQDINSLVTYTTDITEVYRYNRTMRLANTIANDLYQQFSTNYRGIVNNNEQGRSMFQAAIVGYLLDIQNNQGIQNFEASDVTVEPGEAINAIVVNLTIQPVGSVEKVYITITMDA